MAAYMLEMVGDASNYIKLWWSSATELTLAFNDGGGEHSATLDVSALIQQDITYQFAITYSISGMRLLINCDTVLEINEIISFNVVPTLAYWGQDSLGNNVASATFSPPSQYIPVWSWADPCNSQQMELMF